MSVGPEDKPAGPGRQAPIERLIEPHVKDLGEFKVRRSLPARDRQRVGPFIFFDHMGPVDFPPGSGVAVRPHPHIGLATLTYLFEGQIVHRDSLGYVQPIQPGAVNWMTAGRGIVHSERSSEEDLAGGSRLHGIQTWLALPMELEETEPSFDHYAAGALPVIEKSGATVHVIAGELYGQRSPVVTSSETVYAEVNIKSGASLELSTETEELAAYVAAGEIRIGGQSITMGTMAVLNPGIAASIEAQSAAKVMILGGAALPGERHLYWNLVSSRPERIEQAKEDWREGRFDKVPGDDEFIPLPD